MGCLHVTPSLFILFDLAGPHCVDGFGELVSAPRATAEFPEDALGLDLGLARSPGESSCACALFASFWDRGLFSPVRDFRVRGALV
jgi:hypothetical protein